MMILRECCLMLLGIALYSMDVQAALLHSNSVTTFRWFMQDGLVYVEWEEMDQIKLFNKLNLTVEHAKSLRGMQTDETAVMSSQLLDDDQMDGMRVLAKHCMLHIDSRRHIVTEWTIGQDVQYQMLEADMALSPSLLFRQNRLSSGSVHKFANVLATDTADPHAAERLALGKWVISFLIIFAICAGLLKREYWKDIR